MTGPAGPMPGKAMHGHGCPCDKCNAEPAECHLCLALTDALSDDGLCPECVAAGEPS